MLVRLDQVPRIARSGEFLVTEIQNATDYLLVLAFGDASSSTAVVAFPLKPFHKVLNKCIHQFVDPLVLVVFGSQDFVHPILRFLRFFL